MNKPLMCHVVAGYPSAAQCQQLMLGMQERGVKAIEVQIPFSDPIADGETIMLANDVALNSGMTTAKSFDLIKMARGNGLSADIYIMSYLQKVSHYGIDKFCQEAQDCASSGLIIPDLPYDSPEFKLLQASAGKHNLQIVPVLSPGMSQTRLKAVLALKPATIYVTSTQGITGNDYEPAAQLKQLVDLIRRQSNATVMIGFGISSSEDVDNVLAIGDVAVVGSAVIKQLQQADLNAALKLVGELTGGDTA